MRKGVETYFVVPKPKSSIKVQYYAVHMSTNILEVLMWKSSVVKCQILSIVIDLLPYSKQAVAAQTPETV